MLSHLRCCVIAKSNQVSEAVRIRRARAEDAEVCGRICYDAFYKINVDHGFPPDLQEAGVAIGLLAMLFSHPGFWCVVAEQDGRVVGSNCLDERSPVFGVGPITVDPGIQNHGIGRSLMQAVLDRGRERNAPSVRLLQAAFHNRSLSLYTKLGFDSREPISLMQGPSIASAIDGCRIRAAALEDLDAANRVCERVHGHNRSGELIDAIFRGTALVVERQGRITGYTSELAFFGHSAGESNLDLQALITAAKGFGGPGILVPTRNAELFRWCLEKGLRVVQPMTLMTIGLYNEPVGAYLPSVLY
jgi:GNAT superfamily N-acetyltransferase